ncbi:MAG: class I SAM-dependent methyltransferase [Chloroflexi bacterium]|nr:class I SAM-dependent methyltransferase [Chloroflexota bacterium]
MDSQPINSDNLTYSQKLAEEAELWGRVAEEQAEHTPPDWRYLRHARHNVIMHRRDIDALLARVEPDMTALEIGCASGWLTLALAQRGAHARGLDISAKALDVARRYYASVQDEVPGSATYEVADLNTLELPPAAYDVIAAKGVLHHLPHLDHVIAQFHHALKPGGLLWISDTNGDESTLTALAAGALMFVLPTHMPYCEKFRSLLRFRLRSTERVKASIQADGLSPFEGAGRAHDWLKLVEERFVIEQCADAPAITGYLTAQIKLPDRIALPLLRGLYVVDRLLVRLGVLRGTGVTITARKAANTPD